jgi:beta-lactamase superfamily II metal-dependent hydrolase
MEVAKKAMNWVAETWDVELLRDGGVSSASNESSLVLYGTFEERQVLLTGDAGNNALRWAADYADANGLPLQNFNFVQIPHHGSRHNVGPTVLNRLIGSPRPNHLKPTFTAFVSAPKDDETHPRAMVLNAFTRRGAAVHATQGLNKHHRFGYAGRPGYVDSTPVGFSAQVEGYDEV